VTSESRHPDLPRLAAFAARLETLDDAAWGRIAARCGLLDGRSVGGFLSRVELFARSIMPDADPYTQPGARPAFAAMGTVLGILGEIAMALDGRSPEGFERESAGLRQRSPSDERTAGMAAFLAILARAARERPRHAGTAAALQAVAMALLVRPTSDHSVQIVYGPFEPEIAYASLLPSEGHAA
jgi:hypothetical protein